MPQASSGLFATCPAFTRSAPSRRAQSRWRNSRAATARWSGIDPQHRVVLPRTGAAARKVTVQFEGGRPKDFVWHHALGFYPAGTRTRIATTAATSLHLLWTPDPATSAKLDPLLALRRPLDCRECPRDRSRARQRRSGSPVHREPRQRHRHQADASLLNGGRNPSAARIRSVARAATTHHRLCRRPSRRGAEPGRHRIGGLPQPLSSQPVVPPCHGYRASPLRRPTPHRLRPPAGARDRFVDG